MASPSFAARRSSLAGNLLIQDTDDIFIFPHLVTTHQRHVTFDIGRDDGMGSGGIIFGNESFTLGAFAHRSDFLNAIDQAFMTEGDIDNLDRRGTIAFVDSAGNPEAWAFNWIDLLGGFKLGEVPLGVRLSIGRNDFENNITGVGAPVGTSDLTTVDVVVGVRQASYDFSVEVGVFTGTTFDSADVKNVQESFAFRGTAIEESDALKVGWLARISNGNGSAGDLDTSNFGFSAGVGPVYKPSDRTNVAMYGTLEYDRAKLDAGAAGEVTVSNFVGPGWHVAAEVEVASWMQFRAGLRSRYNFVKVSADPGDSELTMNALDYRWTAGLGLNFENFHFNGFLDPTSVTNGTSLFGPDRPLFGMVTASYDF